jgi:hypothetical protein
VYETIIPRTVRLSEAPGFGQPITVYDPRSRGAQCYRDLAQEVISKLPAEGPLPVIEDLPSVVLPPPGPQVTRAPRPLVGVGDDLDDTVRSAEREPLEPAAAGSTPAVEPELELSDRVGRVGGLDEAEVMPDETPVGEAQVGAEDEVEVAEVGPVPVGEPEPEPESPVDAEVERRSMEPARAPEAEREPPTEAAPQVEGGRVVVIQGDVEEVEEAGPAEPEPEEAPRRRWSLFRRGGDR